ncbi:response regulator transcription factor [Oligella ureolytica]
MPGMSGLQLQEQLIERKATLPIVFITGHGDVNMAVSTMKKGAVDFIEKPFNLDEINPIITRFLNQAYEEMQEIISQQEVDGLLARLTGREEQVLERIVAGRLNKQIADDLSINIKTVEAHRANIMEKLEVSTVANLMKIVLKK